VRLAPVAVAALPGCVYPSDLEPSERWFGANRGLIELRMSREGEMRVPACSARRLLDGSRFERTAYLVASVP